MLRGGIGDGMTKDAVFRTTHLTMMTTIREKWREYWWRKRVLVHRARYLEMCRKMGSYCQPIGEFSVNESWAKDNKIRGGRV